MSNLTTIPSQPQDTDAAIVATFDRMLAEDNLYVKPFKGEWGVFEYEDPHQLNGWLTVDVYPTRASAYEAALFVLVDIWAAASNEGGEE